MLWAAQCWDEWKERGGTEERGGMEEKSKLKVGVLKRHSPLALGLTRTSNDHTKEISDRGKNQPGVSP